VNHDEASQAGDALLSVERAKSMGGRRVLVRPQFFVALAVTLLAAMAVGAGGL